MSWLRQGSQDDFLEEQAQAASQKFLILAERRSCAALLKFSTRFASLLPKRLPKHVRLDFLKNIKQNCLRCSQNVFLNFRRAGATPRTEPLPCSQNVSQLIGFQLRSITVLPERLPKTVLERRFGSTVIILSSEGPPPARLSILGEQAQQKDDLGAQ